MSPEPPVVLSISGSDSGAGAGAQADLKTYEAYGVHGTTAITALTAQNTRGVVEALATPPSFVAAQIDAVLADFRLAAAKTGLLGPPEVVEVVADRAATGRFGPFVVDPVLVSSTGAPITPEGTRAAYVERLFPLATVVTPNRDEAALLSGRSIDSVRDLRLAAEVLGEMGAEHVVVKGGRLDGDLATDVIWHAGEVRELHSPRLDTRNHHGSGCTLAAAIAAGLARGRTPDDAIDRAKHFVDRALAAASGWRLGAGRGPLAHRDAAPG